MSPKEILELRALIHELMCDADRGNPNGQLNNRDFEKAVDSKVIEIIRITSTDNSISIGE